MSGSSTAALCVSLSPSCQHSQGSWGEHTPPFFCQHLSSSFFSYPINQQAHSQQTHSTSFCKPFRKTGEKPDFPERKGKKSSAGRLRTTQGSASKACASPSPAYRRASNAILLSIKGAILRIGFQTNVKLKSFAINLYLPVYKHYTMIFNVSAHTHNSGRQGLHVRLIN